MVHSVRGWQLSLAIVLFVCLLVTVEVRAAEPTVEYLGNEVAHLDNTSVLIKTRIAINGGGQLWWGVYYQAYLDFDTPLRKGDGSLLQIHWGDLFPPKNVERAEYDDIRMQIKFETLEAAANLPKGKRTDLWISSYVWDGRGERWMGNGWSARVPLAITTDPSGKVARAEVLPREGGTVPTPAGETAFSVNSFEVRRTNPEGKLKARKAALDIRHLKPKPGLQVFRAMDLRGGIHDFLITGGNFSEVGSDDRGFFFEKINTPEKAREIALLPWSRCLIVKNPQKFSLLTNTLRARGWKEDAALVTPPGSGVEVTEIPGQGYRVSVLMMHRSISEGKERLGTVIHLRYDVAYDGRLGVRATLCLLAPSSAGGAPPGGTGPQAGRMGEEEYSRIARSFLGTEETEEIPGFVRVGNEIVTLPIGDADQARRFLDPGQWPAGARQ